MNKNLFISQLRIQLRGMPEEDIEDVINDYRTYFTEAKVSGLSEEEAIENLGHPREIAKDLLVQYKVGSESDKNSKNVIIAIGLIFFNLTIVLGLVVGAAGAFFGFFIANVMLILSPLFALVALIFQDGYIFELFITFILAGLGLLVFPQLMKLGKFCYESLQTYIQWNIRIIKGVE